MASITLTGEQWKDLRNQPRGAAAGGSVVLDVTAGDLTVTHYPQPAAAGTPFVARKTGSGGNNK
jgi:hypothetical protein